MVEPGDLERLLEGDVSPINEIRVAPHDSVRSAWQRSSRPSLSAVAVRRVLDDVIAGRAMPDLAQLWASFMMRGYLEPVGSPIRPIEIEYEPEHEDQIVEAIAELEQIEDLIDGEPDPARLRRRRRAWQVSSCRW
jgi:hypothetical protein